MLLSTLMGMWLLLLHVPEVEGECRRGVSCMRVWERETRSRCVLVLAARLVLAIFLARLEMVTSRLLLPQNVYN
jgi:hypothetical protein